MFKISWNTEMEAKVYDNKAVLKDTTHIFEVRENAQEDGINDLA